MRYVVEIDKGSDGCDHPPPSRDPMAALRWLEAAFGFEVSVLLPTTGRVGHAEMTFRGVASSRRRMDRTPARRRLPTRPRSAGRHPTHVAGWKVSTPCAEPAKAGPASPRTPRTSSAGARTYRALDPEAMSGASARWSGRSPGRNGAGLRPEGQAARQRPGMDDRAKLPPSAPSSVRAAGRHRLAGAGLRLRAAAGGGGHDSAVMPRTDHRRRLRRWWWARRGPRRQPHGLGRPRPVGARGEGRPRRPLRPGPRRQRRVVRRPGPSPTATGSTPADLEDHPWSFGQTVAVLPAPRWPRPPATPSGGLTLTDWRGPHAAPATATRGRQPGWKRPSASRPSCSSRRRRRTGPRRDAAGNAAVMVGTKWSGATKSRCPSAARSPPRSTSISTTTSTPIAPGLGGREQRSSARRRTSSGDHLPLPRPGRPHLDRPLNGEVVSRGSRSRSWRRVKITG